MRLLFGEGLTKRDCDTWSNALLRTEDNQGVGSFSVVGTKLPGVRNHGQTMAQGGDERLPSLENNDANDPIGWERLERHGALEHLPMIEG